MGIGHPVAIQVVMATRHSKALSSNTRLVLAPMVIHPRSIGLYISCTDGCSPLSSPPAVADNGLPSLSPLLDMHHP